MPEPRSALSDSRRQGLLDSLWHHTIDARYTTIKTAHARTCEWILKKTEYQDWLDISKTQNHHGVLWIKGKPGSGKSTLVKFAVANARKTRAETAVISFFFNARGEDLEKSTLGMYRSLLYQILNTFPDLQSVLDCLRPNVPREGETYKWEKDGLQNLFTAAIQNLGQRRLMCFIDALDECEEDEIRDLVAFLEHLGHLATSSRIHFYVCLSSRHYPHISIENGVEFTLEKQEDHTHDITKYLNGTLKAGRGKQSEQIKEELLQRSSGVFLWVVLVVQILNKEYDHGRILGLRKRLREIPDGLEKLFEDILTRDQQNMEGLILCLQWILYAERPLRQEEVYYAIHSGTDPEALTSTASEEITTQDMERFILSCSKGLAETTRLKARTVQFIHESVREFLLGKHGFNKLRLELGFGLSQDRLKQCCYSYMTIDISEHLPSIMDMPTASSEEGRSLRESIAKKFPFLKYAVHNVLYHADIAEGEAISQKDFLEEFALSNWIMLDNLFEKFQIRHHTSRASLLYILAEKNLSNLIRIQLESELDPTAVERCEDERYASPLNAALANAPIDKNTIQALLTPKLGISYNLAGLHNTQSDLERECTLAVINIIIEKRPSLSPRKGQTLIHWAASHGHEVVINWLLSNGVDPDSKDKKGRSPLSCAAENGHKTIIDLLLSNGVNPKSKDKKGRSPLSWAAENGHETIVDLLLSKDVHPDLKDSTDLTPLSYAASRWHEKVGSAFILNPRLRATSSGHEKVINLLLSKGADPDCKDTHGRTPLYHAIMDGDGNEEVIRLLLSKGADPDVQDMYGRTPVSYAARWGKKTIVDLLLSQGVDPDSRDKANRTPLSYAALNGHKTIVDLLLSKGVDPDSKDSTDRTPLSYVASMGHETIVNLLLSKGADPNSKDTADQTPLIYAALQGHGSVVNLLLSQGVDPDSKDSTSRTPLSYAASYGRETTVDLLLSKGVDPNSRDDKGETPLHHALWCENPNEKIVGLLLSKGADPDFEDEHGRTPLPWAISPNREGIIKLLRAHIKPDLSDKDVH